MVFKLKTSKKTEDIFISIYTSKGLAPFILTKIAIALSLSKEEPLTEKDFETHSNGLELNRQQVTGEYDDIFKALIMLDACKSLKDEEIFPKYIKAHIDRGAKYLEAENQYARDIYEHLATLEKSI